MSTSPFDPDSEGKRLPVDLHPPRDDDWSPPVPREHGYRDDLDPGAAGHDYSEGPPVEPWHGKAGILDVERAARIGLPTVDVRGVRDIPPDEMVKRNLARLLTSMPFVGLVREVDLPDPAKTDDLFVAATYDWLRAYRRIVAEQADDIARQARVVATMKNERAAVRAFFGLSTDDYS